MKPDEETPTYRREIGVRVRFTHKKVSLIMRDLDLALFIVIYRHFIKRLVHLNPVLKCFDSSFFSYPLFLFQNELIFNNFPSFSCLYSNSNAISLFLFL